MSFGLSNKDHFLEQIIVSLPDDAPSQCFEGTLRFDIAEGLQPLFLQWIEETVGVLDVEFFISRLLELLLRPLSLTTKKALAMLLGATVPVERLMNSEGTPNRLARFQTSLSTIAETPLSSFHIRGAVRSEYQTDLSHPAPVSLSVIPEMRFICVCYWTFKLRLKSNVPPGV